MPRGNSRAIKIDPVAWKIVLVVALGIATLVVALFAQRVASTPPHAGPARPIPTFGTPAPTYAQFGNDSMPKDRPTRVLYLGTSITIGYYATTPGQKWTSLVSTELALHGEVQEVSAVRTPQPAGAPTMLSTFDPAAIQTGLDLVVVELTTNDVNRTPINEYIPEYANLLDTIQGGSPSAKVICLGAWQTQPGDWDFAVQRVCANRGATFVSLSDLMKQDGVRGPAGRITEYGISDDFHPNDKGEQVIAQAVLAKLATFFRD